MQFGARRPDRFSWRVIEAAPGAWLKADAAATTETTPAASPQATTDPLAPLPRPDSRLVRDKASRQAAANAERIAASDVTRRQQGDDIVQLGTRAGRLLRWTFSAIQADSFRWQGHALGDDGKTWLPEVDIQFRRQ